MKNGIDVCSSLELKDGWGNRLIGSDDLTCLSATRIGDQYSSCQNLFDKVWFGSGKELAFLDCKDRRKDECFLLRQYIDQSWASALMNKSSEPRIPFRWYCDSFGDLQSGDDENLLECGSWWICPTGEDRCQNGQCVRQLRFNGNPDCLFGEDEYGCSSINLVPETQLSYCEVRRSS